MKKEDRILPETHGRVFWGVAGIILATPTLVALKVISEHASGGKPVLNFLSPHTDT
jgi:predicted PurR-regulated permease PerM